MEAFLIILIAMLFGAVFTIAYILYETREHLIALQNNQKKFNDHVLLLGKLLKKEDA